MNDLEEMEDLLDDLRIGGAFVAIGAAYGLLAEFGIVIGASAGTTAIPQAVTPVVDPGWLSLYGELL